MACPLLGPALVRVSWCLALAAAAAALLVARSAHLAPNDVAEERKRARCATRLSVALLGESPDDDLLAATDPQARVEELLQRPEFVEQFARFINSKMNVEPGEIPAEDASYYLARYILENNRPWHELFDGPYAVVRRSIDGKPSGDVVQRENGLGYFRSRPWMKRYAGNEEDGYRIVAAYRIMQNIIGLEVSAVNNEPDVDTSSEGRKAPACRGCHYDGYFALDKAAKILSKRVGEDADMTFEPPTEGPQTFLDGREIANDAEFVAALVDSVDFRFRSCRLVFEYLYGRAEATCEAPIFDACMTAFEKTGDIREALRSVAQDPGFCES